MKVVFDTNVLVSAAITAGGTCARIVDLLLNGEFDFCADDRILDEYEEVLQRPELGICQADAVALLELLRSLNKPVAAMPLPTSLPDPDDLAFLEVATAAGAILVTGNLRHFPKKACKGTAVVSPTDFLEFLRNCPE